MPEIIKQSVAEVFRGNVRRVMDRKGISVSELARLAEMSRPGLSRVLNGHEVVSMSRAERIAEALETELWKIIKESTNVT